MSGDDYNANATPESQDQENLHPYQKDKNLMLNDVGSVVCALAQAIRVRRYEKDENSYSAKLSKLGLEEVIRAMSDAMCCCAMDVASGKGKKKEEITHNAVDMVYLMVLLIENLGIPVTDIMYFLSDRIEKSGFDVLETALQYDPSNNHTYEEGLLKNDSLEGSDNYEDEYGSDDDSDNYSDQDLLDDNYDDKYSQDSYGEYAASKSSKNEDIYSGSYDRSPDRSKFSDTAMMSYVQDYDDYFR